MARQPGKGLMRKLEEQAEGLAHTFKAQGVANTLWAYATLGRQLGEGLMRKLEEQAEGLAHTFKSQEVVNTLWATCFFSTQYSDAACRFFRVLSSKLSGLELLCSEEEQLRQMHQFLVACDVEEGVRARMPDSFVSLKERLGPKCQACFFANPTQASVSQEEVSAILRGTGLSVEDEFQCPKSGYSIDMRVQDKRLDGSSSSGCGAGWVVEFDGPSHFFGCKAATGATLIKRRHLELLGYRLVSVPFWVRCRPRV
jgi:hypothetical protein